MLKHTASAMVILAMIAIPAVAQDPSKPSIPATKPITSAATATEPSAAPVITEQKPTELRANSIIGMRVSGAQDEKVGKIYDLVLDQQGKITGVVLSVGGFLGVGDKRVALPLEKVRLTSGDKGAVIDMSRDELVKAPDFKTKEQVDAERHAELARQQVERERATQLPGPGRTLPTR